MKNGNLTVIPSGARSTESKNLCTEMTLLKRAGAKILRLALLAQDNWAVHFTKTISRVMSARVFAPHMDMVSASSPPIFSMYSFTPSSAPP